MYETKTYTSKTIVEDGKQYLMFELIRPKVEYMTFVLTRPNEVEHVTTKLTENKTLEGRLTR